MALGVAAGQLLLTLNCCALSKVRGDNGAGEIAALLHRRGLRFSFILDECGVVTEDTLFPGQAAM